MRAPSLMRNLVTGIKGFLLLCCILPLAGCWPEQGGSEPTNQSVPGFLHNQTESGAEEPVITLGFSQLGSESDWRKANTVSILQAAEEAGIKLEFANAEQSQERQFEAIRTFVRQRADVIALAPVIQKGWEPILREVQQAGIPVIILDRSVEVDDPSLYVTFIGSDFYEEGRKAGKYLLDKVAAQTFIKPVGVVELKGTEGSTPSIERGRGFGDIIGKNPNLKVLDSAYADFTQELGKRTMAEFLARWGGEIDVLFAHNDDMALGAIEAIEEYGLRPGKDIIIISVDGSKKALQKLAEGKINSVVECNPLLGPRLMQAVKEIKAGRTLPKRIVTPETVFTEVTAGSEIPNRQY